MQGTGQVEISSYTKDLTGRYMNDHEIREMIDIIYGNPDKDTEEYKNALILATNIERSEAEECINEK